MMTMCFLLLEIRGEDAGTLVCYKLGMGEEDKARLELRVLGNHYTPRVFMLLYFYRSTHVVRAPYCYRKSSVRPYVCL